MGPLANFMEYAQAFELSYDDDDWSRIERFFAPDAVYDVRSSFGCRLIGRDAILRGFKKSLDGFDRKMAKRTIDITDPPVEAGDTMTVGWTVWYEKPGAPRFGLRGRTTARYRGDVIAELVDEYTDEMGKEVEAWVRQYAPGFDPSYT